MSDRYNEGLASNKMSSFIFHGEHLTINIYIQDYFYF